jgi:hypothetical protein
VVSMFYSQELVQFPQHLEYWQNAMKICFCGKFHRVGPISSLRHWISLLGTAQIKVIHSPSVLRILEMFLLTQMRPSRSRRPIGPHTVHCGFHSSGSTLHSFVASSPTSSPLSASPHSISTSVPAVCFDIVIP